MRTLTGLLALLALLAACAGSPGSDPGSDPAPPPTVTVEYAAGRTADLYLPEVGRPAPLVVMVPGGGWVTADPTGLAPLAARLVDAGIIAAPVRIRAASDGATYPDPVEDVLCATASAVVEARSRGYDPRPVVVLGHSSGAHLAALAVLAVDDYTPSCDAPDVRPDALVGLSGPYDISQVPDIAGALLGSGPGEDPELWRDANPVERAGLRPGVPVLLLHGEDDVTVPPAFTTQFADALESAGHAVTVEIVAGVDHDAIYRAEVVGDLIVRWLT
jgi:acetyl esterase/lipase